MIEFNSFNRTNFFNKNETGFSKGWDYLDIMNNFDKFFNFWECGSGGDSFTNSTDGNIVHKHNDKIFNEMIIWNIIRRMLKDYFYKESSGLKRIPLRYAKHSNPL